MGTHHNFVLQPGYVEDSRLCTMSVSHSEGFDTIEEAVENFRQTLVSYLRTHLEYWKCCQKYAKTKEFDFCPKCGQLLERVRGSDPGDVSELFLSLPMMTIDEASGKGIFEHFEKNGWELGCMKGSEPPCMVQAVGRWMEREDEEDRPYLEGTYPDGTHWSSYDDR